MPVVIPELVYVVGLFFAVVGYLMARGALATYTHSIGFLLHGLEGVLKFSAGRGFAKVTIDLGGPVRALDHAIVSALQNWCDGAEIEMGYCLHGMEKVGQFMAQAIDLLARETASTFEWLVHVHLPKWAKYLTAAAVPFGLIAKLVHNAVAHELPRISKQVKVIEHTLPGKTITIIKHAAAIPVAIPVAIPRLWRGIDDAESDIRKLAKRVSKTEALFGATAMALAMANVLGLRSANCLRKGPLGRVSRALCGLSGSALNDILGLLADVVIFEDICAVIPLLSEAFSVVEAPLNGFVGVVGGALCHGDYDAPPAIDVPALSLPPVRGRTLSLA